MARVSTRANAAPRRAVRRALAEVLGTPGRVAGFLAAAGVVAFFYTLLLPFDYTQRFELANWDYLSGSLLAWALVLGLGMGLVMSIQVYAMRQIHATRRIAAARAASGAAGAVAFVASLLPTFLCCTPIVPSVLAFFGVSGMGLYTTSGTLQHFFAVHQTEFLAGSLALLVLMSWWGLHKVARAACLADGGCALDAAPDQVPPAVTDCSCGGLELAGARLTGDQQDEADHP